MAKPLLKKKQVIVFEGDSGTSRCRLADRDTWAFLRLMNWHVTYADLVGEWLFCNRPDLALNIFNTAVAGAKCYDMASRYESLVKPRKPDWVIFTLGGNDAAVNVPAKQFRQTIRDYAQWVKDDSGGRMFCVGGFVKKTQPAPIRRRRMRNYRILREVMAECGGIYLDAGTPLARKEKLLIQHSAMHTIVSDNHYNIVGATIIANQVLQGLRILKIIEP